MDLVWHIFDHEWKSDEDVVTAVCTALTDTHTLDSHPVKEHSVCEWTIQRQFFFFSFWHFLLLLDQQYVRKRHSAPSQQIWQTLLSHAYLHAETNFWYGILLKNTRHVNEKRQGLMHKFHNYWPTQLGFVAKTNCLWMVLFSKNHAMYPMGINCPTWAVYTRLE